MLSHLRNYGNPQWTLPNFPQLFPPKRSFCPQKLYWVYCSSGIRLTWISSWSTSWLLKYDVGIHFASSIGYPCHSTKNSRHHCLVFELHLHCSIFSTSKCSGLSVSSSSTSPRTCYTRLSLHCLSNDMWNTEWILHEVKEFQLLCLSPMHSRIL